jgi:hypothetical protein
LWYVVLGGRLLVLSLFCIGVMRRFPPESIPNEVKDGNDKGGERRIKVERRNWKV